jgi:uncharacterized membrane protein HdeD (DUF308 family)
MRGFKVESKNKTGSFEFKWKIFTAGIVSIIAGYVFLAGNDITIAPVLLVLGYCVLVPLSFL